MINELKTELSGTSNQLENKAEALTAKNRMVEKENEVLKNNITMKEREIKNMTERLKASSERESKLEADIDDLRNKMVKKDQKNNETVLDQKNRMETSFAYALENIKSDHEASLRLEANRYRDLQEKLRKKEAELEQLLKLYKKMTE